MISLIAEKIQRIVIGSSSLVVFQHIVASQIKVKSVRLIRHPVSINWRQIHKMGNEKIDNLKTGLLHLVPLEDKWFKRSVFLDLNLKTLQILKNNEVWSVNSKVMCYGTEDFSVDYSMHIPMINFHPESGVGVGDIIETINAICPNQEGYLLESGRYYHYYGNCLLNEREWQLFLAQFLMPCIIVSPRYIGHALSDGYCSLRLTAEAIYKPKIPTVIQIL